MEEGGKEVRQRGRAAGEFGDCLCALFLFAGQKNRLEKEVWGGGGGREGWVRESLRSRIPAGWAAGPGTWRAELDGPTSPPRSAPHPALDSAQPRGSTALRTCPEQSLPARPELFFPIFFSKGVLLAFSSL